MVCLMLVFRRGRFELTMNPIEVVSDLVAHEFVVKISYDFARGVADIIDKLFDHE